MRLIDADALMKEFIEFVKDSNNSDFADVPTWNDAVSLLGSAPDVEAITVEWIEEWLDKITGTRDGEDISKLPEQLKFAIQMINLMEMDWRKENGN